MSETHKPSIVISKPRFVLPKNMNNVDKIGMGEIANNSGSQGRCGITDRFNDEPTAAHKLRTNNEKIHLPPPLLWSTLPPPHDPDYMHAINHYAQETCATLSFICQSSLKKWNFMSEDDGIKAFCRKVEGSQIPIVRHELEINAPASLVLDLYNKLNYTWCVDAYTYDLYGVEDIATTDLKWLQVVHTVDQMPLPLLNIRDFCTLDFVDPHRMMLVSKSVVHPKLAAVPSNWIRMPLCYALRVERINENMCKVVQVQWSDVAGAVHPEFIKHGVEQFGFDFFHRFVSMIACCQKHNLNVGINSNTYLESPLQNGWIRQPTEMVPGIQLLMEEPEFPFAPLAAASSKL